MAKDDLDFSGGLGDYRTRLGQAYKEAEDRNKGTGFFGRLGEAFLTRVVVDPLAAAASESVTKALNMPRERRMSKMLENADRLAERQQAKLNDKRVKESELFFTSARDSNMTPIDYRMKQQENAVFNQFTNQKFEDTPTNFDPSIVNKQYVLELTKDARRKQAEAYVARQRTLNDLGQKGYLTFDETVANQRELVEELNPNFISRVWQKVTPKDEAAMVISKYRENPKLQNSIAIQNALDQAETSGDLKHITDALSEIKATDIPEEMKGSLIKSAASFEVDKDTGQVYRVTSNTYKVGSTLKEIPTRELVPIENTKDGVALVNRTLPTINAYIDSRTFRGEEKGKLKQTIIDEVFNGNKTALLSNLNMGKPLYDKAFNMILAKEEEVSLYGTSAEKQQAENLMSMTRLIISSDRLAAAFDVVNSPDRDAPVGSDRYNKWLSANKDAERKISITLGKLKNVANLGIGLTNQQISIGTNKETGAFQAVPLGSIIIKSQSNAETGVMDVQYAFPDNISPEEQARRIKNFKLFEAGKFEKVPLQRKVPVEKEDNSFNNETKNLSSTVFDNSPNLEVKNLSFAEKIRQRKKEDPNFRSLIDLPTTVAAR